MWVFTYKFDKDEYLLKDKARIIVRGDLQDTHAATLAARLFRARVAFACAFNLRAVQHDVPNAFLSVVLDHTLDVRTPDGFQDKCGRTLRLLRALYGLKEAPRLWAIHYQISPRKLVLHPFKVFLASGRTTESLSSSMWMILSISTILTTKTVSGRLNNSLLSSITYVR
jgi:hypothetical protein